MREKDRKIVDFEKEWERGNCDERERERESETRESCNEDIGKEGEEMGLTATQKEIRREKREIRREKRLRN